MTLERWSLAAGLALSLAAPQLLPAQDAPPKPEELFQQLDKNGDGKLTADEVPQEQRRFFDRLLRVGDKDSDGVLTKDEFLQANRPQDNPNIPLAQFGGAPGRGGDARQRFEMLDRNKDGKVTLDEVPEPFRDRLKPVFDRLGKTELTAEEFARVAGGPGGARPEPGELFRRFDANNDGKLTRDEIPAEFRERMAQAFERIGKDELTREDFAEMMRRVMEQGGGAPGRPEGGPAPRLPRAFVLLDANRDGRISKEEMAKVAAQFDELDENKDGELDLREFFGPPPEGFAGGRPEMRRPDGGRPEGGRPEGGRPEGGRPETARPESPRPEGGRPGAPAGPNPLFARMDRNGDGKISKEEAPERMRENFGQLDKDGDGFLTLDELRQSFERLRGGDAPQRPEGERRPRRPATEEQPTLKF